MSLVNRSIFELPTIATAKGTFFVKNYTDTDPDETGICLYDEDGSFIIQLSGSCYDELDEVSEEELRMNIEANDDV